jgi:hypothetical protein
MHSLYRAIKSPQTAQIRLTGFTKQSILQLTGLTDSQLRREHALELIQQKAAAEEARKREFLPFNKRSRAKKKRMSR